MVLRAFLFLIGERKVPLFIRFIVEIPLLVTVYSNFTGATLWGTVLLWQANRRGAGGERKVPLQAALHDSSAGSSFLSRGLTRRLRRGSGTCRPTGRSHFSFDGERKVCKRKPAARRLQRRPTSLCTAAKPCAALGLGYALHGFQPFLALVGLRPPLAVGFGLREPNGWTTRINSGRPIPA